MSGAVATRELPAPVLGDAPPPTPAPVPRLVQGAAIAGAALTALIAAGLATHVISVGSRAGLHRYPFDRYFSPPQLWPFAVACAAVLGLLWLSLRTYRRYEWPTVLGWMLAAVPLQLLVRWYAGASLPKLVMSDRANSFYSPSLRWGAREFISSYLDIVRHLPHHARTNMPGKTLLYHLLGEFTHSPLGLGIGVIVASNLGALLAYLIVRDLLNDRRAALFALVLCVFLPGKVYFLPVLNVVSPVPILLAFWLLVRWMKSGRWAYAVLMGPALYLTLFFEPLPLAMGVVFAAVLALALWQKTITWKDTAGLLTVVLVAFAACHALMVALFGYDIFANFAYVLADARDFNARTHRPYDVWLVRNPRDLIICAGAASMVMVAAAAWDAIRGPIARPAAVLTLSCLAVLAILDIAGVNRGETVRLWIFLAAFLQISAAWMCARARSLWPFAVVLAATLLQTSLGAALVGFVRA